ncbi:ASPIC/UnbV domain-containing protein, partial [Akkermansiaceae bacterium]|nr:ASPIC/UnbV domain-containing protein [Akkermansiaceae bacterium]
ASTSSPRLRIFRNRFSEIGNNEKGRLVRLNLTGTKSNRDAAGSIIIAHTSKTKRAFQKTLGQGLSSQNSPSIFITVPPKDSLEKLTVHWPSGKITNYKPTGSETVISITE